jgi:hypothetical protein
MNFVILKFILCNSKINFPLAVAAAVSWRICKESYEIVSRSIEMSFFIATEAFRAGARAIRDKYFIQTALKLKLYVKNNRKKKTVNIFKTLVVQKKKKMLLLLLKLTSLKQITVGWKANKNKCM